MSLAEDKPFRPHPLLKNGHTMTIAPVFLRRHFVLPHAEERCFQVDSDSRILGHCHWQNGKDRDAPVLVLVHGLEGSSTSNYMLGIAEKAGQRGFHVIRLNQRNCGGTELLTPTLYNSGMSGDYRAVLEELAKGEPEWTVFNPSYIGLWYQFLEMRLFEALGFIGRANHAYRGGGGSIWKALARTLIMDEKDVPFARLHANYGDAVSRASDLDAWQRSRGQDGANPSTGVHKLTEHIRSFSRSKN